MNRATRTVLAIFGTVAALAGMEHGIGEILQGNVRPEGLMFQSWPDARFFEIVSGEPAMSLIPNMLVSGILTVLVSLAFLVWVHGFVHRRLGGLVLIGISVVLLLVGGGFGPPVLGLGLGLAASRIRSPHGWALRTRRLGQLLSSAWPWMVGGALTAWLVLMPGVPLLALAFGTDSAMLVIVAFFSAVGLLTLSVFAAYARDARAGTTALVQP